MPSERRLMGPKHYNLKDWNFPVEYSIKDMDPQQKRQYQQGWGSTTSSCQVCHWRLPAHKLCHSHATATPVTDITEHTNVLPDSDDVPHSVQPCWYTECTSWTPPQPHLYSIRTRGHSLWFLVPHTRTTVYRTSFSQKPYLWNLLPGSVVEADILDSCGTVALYGPFFLFFFLWQVPPSRSRDFSNYNPIIVCVFAVYK